MFIEIWRARKGLIISASALSLILHAGLIWILLQLKTPDPQANIALQKALTVKLSATTISTTTSVSKSIATEDIKIKQSLTEVKRQAKIIQQSKSQPETKNLKPAVSEVAKSSPVKPGLQRVAAVDAPKPEALSKPESFTNQTLQAEQLPKAIQALESDLERLASSSQTSKQEPVSTSTIISGKPRYQLGSKANPNPDYPMLARKKGWQGDVVLGVHVAADGSIEHLTFVKSTNYGVLNFAAYETVRNHWRFQPLSEESVPLTAYIEVPISFRFN